VSSFSPRQDDPERHLPAELRERASQRGNEYGWRIEDIPVVIESARIAGLVSVGGQLQFRFQSGTCEVWSMEVQPHCQLPPDLAWDEEVEMAAKVAADQFRDLLSKFDLVQEGRKMFPVSFAAEEREGRNARAAMWFVWYLSERTG
jgi:hypothetical protein